MPWGKWRSSGIRPARDSPVMKARRSQLSPKMGRMGDGASELFVSDLSKVKDFYEGVFGWSLEAEEGQSERYLIRNEGKHIGAVQVASNEEKGDKEFWGVFFGVRNAEETLASIREAGGEVSYEHQNSSGTHYLVYDPQGAAFFVT